MNRHRGAIGALPAVAALVCGAWQPPAQPPALQQPPTFRTNTSIVPIDVRVMDKDGKAVADLTRADFTVSEDGAPQTVTQFEKQTGDAAANPRWIVVVLGEGRINAPFESIDALEDMIRSALRPNDRIGVIAYNRWSDFSADHASTIRLLERYKGRTDRIQTDLETHNSGLRANTLDGITVEDRVQREIDEIFRDAPGQSLREFAPPSQMGRMSPGFEARTRFTQGRFSDSLHLYGAIDYLRTLGGEKHVIFLVEQGSTYGPVRPSRLAATAADNRIALHIVQTGGFGERQTVAALLPRPGYGGSVLPPTSVASSFDATGSARAVTEDTGGLSFFYTDLHKAFARIGEALRVDYLLGYVPSNDQWHGEYRHIEVRVNRPGTTVIYRRGYDAIAGPPPWNDRETMTDVRMTEARTAARPPQGIVLRLSARRAGDGRIDIELDIEPSQVAFAIADGRHAAHLDVGLWITDRQGGTVGTARDRIDLRLTDESYAKLVKQHIVFTRSLVVTGTPFEARAGVYDYDSDRVGAIVKRIP
jgi:VWFA-related protein